MTSPVRERGAFRGFPRLHVGLAWYFSHQIEA